VPFGTPITALILVVLAVIALAGLFTAFSRHRRDVVPWLALAGCSLVLIALAYASYVPSDPHWYEPLSAGPSNRINALAGIGYVGVVYGLGGVAMTLAAGRRVALAAVLPAVLALAVGAGYLHETRRDAARWNSAFAAEQRALTVVKGAVPGPAHGTAIYMFGHQPTLAGGIPVFASTWDLEAAVQLTYRDRTLHGYPVVGGTEIVCAARTMYPNGNGYWPGYAAPYGSQVFVNVATGVAERVTSLAACRDRGAEFTAG